MLISSKVHAKLNEQITHEFYAAHAYLAMACVLNDMGLRIMAAWFEHHAMEERSHGMKIVKFLNEVGGKVSLDEIPKPKADYNSVEDILKAALDHEMEVTRLINEIVDVAEKDRDYASRSFLNWFVDEQVEEVAVVTEVLDLVKLSAGKNLLQVESRVAKMLEEDDDDED